MSDSEGKLTHPEFECDATVNVSVEAMGLSWNLAGRLHRITADAVMTEARNRATDANPDAAVLVFSRLSSSGASRVKRVGPRGEVA